MEQKRRMKMIISIFVGLIISLYYFLEIDSFIFYYRNGMTTFDNILLRVISYLTIIAFFILWNINKSKKLYLLLVIPLFCTFVMPYIIYNIRYIRIQIISEYQKSIENIPTVGEYGINLYEYWPFKQNNLLARLNEESTIKLIDNLPILDGATAFFPIYASFVQAVYCEYNFSNMQLLCSRTEKAYENLLEGNVDIIFCLEPSDLHLKQFQDNGLKLRLIPIGKEAFVFFVNKENSINNLTIENIRNIYSGKILNWRELNGLDQNIIAFQRPKNSGSQTIFEKIMSNTAIIKPRMELIPTEMAEIINRVANYRNFPNAIGYSFLHYSTEMVKNDQIKLLSINNIFPSDETIQDGSYPFSEYIYAIYIDSENKNENIELFIEWILSSQGQILISKTGYIPINNE